MKKIFAVAKWEYLDKVRRKAFWIGVLLLPLIIAASSIIPTLIANKADDHTKTIGIVDLTDSLTTPLGQYLDSNYRLPNGTPNYALQPLPVDKSLPLDSIRKRCDKMTTEHLVATYMIIPHAQSADAKIKNDTVEYRGSSVSNIRDADRLEHSVKQVMLEQTLRREGINVSQFNNAQRDITLKPIEVSQTGEAKEKGFLETFGVAYAFLILLMMMVMTSGQLLVRSMVEEKSNRIIEVLFSSASPSEIMTGKVLGLSAVGITQVILLIVIAVALLTQTSFDFSTLQHILLVLIYFILGYTLFSALFVGVGSIVTTEQEAQQITSYLSLLFIFLPLMFLINETQNPNDLTMKILSQIPLFTPAFMMIRIPVQSPEWWEIALSLTTLILTIAIVIKISSKIFRLAMLMYGKRPTLKEIVRLAR